MVEAVGVRRKYVIYSPCCTKPPEDKPLFFQPPVRYLVTLADITDLTELCES